VSWRTVFTLKEYIELYHDGNVTAAGVALGNDRSTLHRVMSIAYVVHGKLYTPARASK